MFGIRASQYQDRLDEIQGERHWTFKTHPIRVHVEFAKNSARVGEKIIHELLRRPKRDGASKVLDVGSGWGCFQSWQFATHNFEVAAVELCPEFVFSSDVVAKDVNFLRSVSDCSILPFRDGIFDVVFCKELVHHLADANILLDEIWRVCAPEGLIVVTEPSTPIMRNKRSVVRGDRAAKSGITHHSYTYGDYLRYIRPITTSLEIEGEIHTIDPAVHPLLHSIQKPLLRLFGVTQSRKWPSTIRKAALHFALIFIGGSVLFMGKKNSTHIAAYHDRQVVPITEELLDPKMEETSRMVVKRVFPVYQRARENCGFALGQTLSKHASVRLVSATEDAARTHTAR